MILIDDRIGSGELAKYFKNGTAQLATLDSADFCFVGNGPGGESWLVGIERKKIRDLLGDLGRFTSGQLPKMLDDYQARFLIIEGIWRRNYSTGLLEVPRSRRWEPLALGSRQFMHKELDGILNTFSLVAGLQVRQTADEKETVALVLSIYRWFTSKEFDEHRAHLAQEPTVAVLRKPNLVERIAKELPGIGWKKARAVSRRFKTPVELALSQSADWLEIPGIGKTLAGRVVGALRGD